MWTGDCHFGTIKWNRSFVRSLKYELMYPEYVTQLLKLEVERHYGKITAVSYKRAVEHETQRFTILFPASLEADIRAGDLFDYRIAAFHPIGRESNATEP